MAVVRGQAGDLCRDLQGHVSVDAGNLSIRFGGNNGYAGISLLAYGQGKRQCAQVGYAVRLCQLFAAVLSEDMFLMPALAANMHGHVFQYAQYGYVHLLEHVYAFLHIQQGNVLRCGDGDCACEWYALVHGDLNVPRPGRHVNYKIIQ